MNPAIFRRTTSREQSRGAVAACLVAAAVVLSATACSGDGSGSGSKSGGSASGNKKTEEDQALEHRKCLREQGLDVAEPKPGEDGRGITIGGGGKSKKEMEKAFKACQDKAVGGGPKELTQAEKDKAVAFARCMRKNGFDMPDPKFDGGAMQAAPMMKPKDMKKFEKANAACESVGR
ncbi:MULTISPECIES: hypothetical protein [unclassified Streptomyces]|jgi:hypothetical protein|uniref:hypothetical protein n=1 Tax=unclassified Streptomyces TaxID=2593676 RepID=UPI00081BAC4A|nr:MULTISPECIES: hypothetical protein [unclassified Streptomyces]MYQ83828.1 hypothetical protein [Streptomyces sp. SID4936]SCD73781.1 hypothetical protein GA0115234_1042291 [Streptomyces sp. DvalAA-43]